MENPQLTGWHESREVAERCGSDVQTVRRIADLVGVPDGIAMSDRVADLIVEAIAKEEADDLEHDNNWCAQYVKDALARTDEPAAETDVSLNPDLPGTLAQQKLKWWVERPRLPILKSIYLNVCDDPERVLGPAWREFYAPAYDTVRPDVAEEIVQFVRDFPRAMDTDPTAQDIRRHLDRVFDERGQRRPEWVSLATLSGRCHNEEVILCDLWMGALEWAIRDKGGCIYEVRPDVAAEIQCLCEASEQPPTIKQIRDHLALLFDETGKRRAVVPKKTRKTNPRVLWDTVTFSGGQWIDSDQLARKLMPHSDMVVIESLPTWTHRVCLTRHDDDSVSTLLFYRRDIAEQMVVLARSGIRSHQIVPSTLEWIAQHYDRDGQRVQPCDFLVQDDQGSLKVQERIPSPFPEVVLDAAADAVRNQDRQKERPHRIEERMLRHRATQILQDAVRNQQEPEDDAPVLPEPESVERTRLDVLESTVGTLADWLKDLDLEMHGGDPTRPRKGTPLEDKVNQLGRQVDSLKSAKSQLLEEFRKLAQLFEPQLEWHRLVDEDGYSHGDYVETPGLLTRVEILEAAANITQNRLGHLEFDVRGLTSRLDFLAQYHAKVIDERLDVLETAKSLDQRCKSYEHTIHDIQNHLDSLARHPQLGGKE